MNDLLALVAHNSVVALMMAVVVYVVSRVWRNPPLIHLLWVIVLVKLIAPPIVSLDWQIDWPRQPTNLDPVAKSGLTTDPFAKHVRSPAVTNEIVATRFAADQSNVALQSPNPIESIPPVIGISRLEVWFSFDSNRASYILLCVWLCGAIGIALIAIFRIHRFNRRLSETLPPPQRLQEIVRSVAAQMGLRRVPRVVYAEGIDVPFVWNSRWTPSLVLPRRLFAQLDDQSASMIVAHELAHLYRRDHWVRIVEMCVTVIYWWNPFLWPIRRGLHEAEDACCDAWVRRLFPGQMTRYAEVVLDVAESVSTRQTSFSLLPVSPLFHSTPLKERLEMVMQGRSACQLTSRCKILFAVLAIGVLPLFVKPQLQSVSSAAEPPTVTSQSPAPPVTVPPTTTPLNANFPYVVKFEQGKTNFLEGDSITIVEVRGTAETMKPGCHYLIKGTYQLNSHEKADLFAFTSFANPKDWLTDLCKPLPTMTVERGSGNFSLSFPMSHQGWPMVGFIPPGGGPGFGVNYFGTDETVLKDFTILQEVSERMNSVTIAHSKVLRARLVAAEAEVKLKEAEIEYTSKLSKEQIVSMSGLVSPQEQLVNAKKAAKELKSQVSGLDAAKADADDTHLRKFETRTKDDFYPELFRHVVPFETGKAYSESGNRITIQEVRGTSDTIALGNFYLIKGTYALNSHDSGVLAAYTTAAEARDGTSETLEFQHFKVKRGEGSFTLILPMWCKGWPHIACYAGGKNVADVYYGTGDTVLKK